MTNPAAAAAEAAARNASEATRGAEEEADGDEEEPFRLAIAPQPHRAVCTP